MILPEYTTWAESERREIAQECRDGAFITQIMRRHHHSYYAVERYLKTIGLEWASRGRRGCWQPRVMDKQSSPAMHSFAASLLLATEILGHAPDEAAIGRIMEMVREESGGHPYVMRTLKEGVVA